MDGYFETVAKQHFRAALGTHRFAAHGGPACQATARFCCAICIDGVSVLVEGSTRGIAAGSQHAASVAYAGARHVHFAEGALVFGEFPLAEEAEGAHAEGQNRG